MLNILDKTFVPFITREAIEKRVQALGQTINADYKGRCPLFIVVLNGGFLFAGDLFKNLSVECEISFIRLSSYTQTESTGNVRQIIGLEESIENRDIVIVEDIVDTGLTMAELLRQIGERSPRSVEIATLLHKPEALKVPVSLKYIGFEIENKFVVGYGLDYDGLGRNLDSLYVLA